ncbi:MIP/aquaporin family protein [Spirosoma arcticum]
MAAPRSTVTLFLAEFVGTALLIAVGLSVVIFDWGTGSIMATLVPVESSRRALTGFLFGTTGCLITLSPVGKISGAHINPVVSLAFWLRGKMKITTMLGYLISQMLGAAVGSLPLLLWGQQGRSIQYGVTLPGDAGLWAAFWGEVVTTAALIVVIFVFVGSRQLKSFTPFTMPVLYSVLVWAESPLSGCSTNPARSFGPALISHNFTDYWLYWVAPVTGVLIVVGLFRLLRLHYYYRIEAARISYHNSQTHESLKTN